MNERIQPLTPPAFYVLLSLYDKERHGYEIMKQVEEHSGKNVHIGPGTLYGLVKRLLSERLIEESDERPDPNLDDERRRYYRITKAGRKRLGLEVSRYEQAVAQAQKLRIDLHMAATP